MRSVVCTVYYAYCRHVSFQIFFFSNKRKKLSNMGYLPPGILVSDLSDLLLETPKQ